MIIEAMLPLLLEHGEMVTTRQIAEAAGIAEGTIFRVFADKDELIAAVVDHATDPTRSSRRFAAIDVDLPLEAAVTEAVRILQRRTLDMARLMASRRPAPPPPGPDARPPGPGRPVRRPTVTRSPSSRPPPPAGWPALTMSTSHPMIASELLPPERIAALFLHGVGNEAPPC